MWSNVTPNTLLYIPMKTDLLDHSNYNRSITNNWVSVSWWIWVFNWSSNLNAWTDERTKFQKLANWTISVWFKITAWQWSWQNAYVIWKARMHPNTQSNIIYWIWYQSDWKLVAWVFPWNSRSPAPVPYWSTIQLSLNTWYNIVLTKSWTTKKVYINWSIVATQTLQDTTSTDNPPLTIWSATYYNSNSYITWNISRVIMEEITWNDTDISKDYMKMKNNYN